VAADEVSVIHGTFAAAVQEHWESVVTETVPTPPELVNGWWFGATAKTHGALGHTLEGTDTVTLLESVVPFALRARMK